MTNTPTTLPKYELVCGLEIHAELKTASKMFCSCKNDPFGADQPNSYTCPVCLGMPGGLPVANQKAIEWTLLLGLSLGCNINLFSKFDRKNYFYPDLPKGYQISQYDIPFCVDGKISTSQGDIRIRRIHLEEDTGKLLHKNIDGKDATLIDFNRSGVPLVEIVTEPDIISPEQAKEYGKKIRQQLRYLGIADCDMEQGGMRLEANISIRPIGTTDLPTYKVEVKNINSFRFLEQAIAFEMKRHQVLLENNQIPDQETRGWNATTSETFSQRTKEDAEDYRYFPDPDLPPLRFTKEFISGLRNSLPEPLLSIKDRWLTAGVSKSDAETLFASSSDISLIDQLQTEAKQQSLEPAKVLSALINKKISLDSGVAKALAAYKSATLTIDIDDSKLTELLTSLVSELPDEFSRYKAGETKLLNVFIGQVMRQLKQKIDTSKIKTILDTL